MIIESPINYMGSKYVLLDKLLPLFPMRHETFIDLFTGGGSVYMNVCPYYTKVVANDILKDLIGIHERLTLASFIDEASGLSIPTKKSQSDYILLRADYNVAPTAEKLLALIWSCNSNMMRFNNAFEFNQTWGQRCFNQSTLKKWKRFSVGDYSNVSFTNHSFDTFCLSSYEDPFIYLDPPYSNTEAGYNAFWSKTHEQKLIVMIQDFLDRGISFGLSGVINGKPNRLYDAIHADERVKVFYFDDLYQKISKKDKVNIEYYITNDYTKAVSTNLTTYTPKQPRQGSLL